MKPNVKQMTIVEYLDNGKQTKEYIVTNPTWPSIEEAVRKMDNSQFPIVTLNCVDLSQQDSSFEDEEAFNIIGGNGKLALVHQYGEWQYTNENGGNNEVRLWESDQGYFCKERNVIYDIEFALRIVKKYCETGSYELLDKVV